MTDNRKTLIEYRLTQARDSLREADILNQSGMSLRSVMNRLYYAMFYAVLALLQNKEMGTSKHSGAISIFDREYIKAAFSPGRCRRRFTGLLSCAKKRIIWKRPR